MSNYVGRLRDYEAILKGTISVDGHALEFIDHTKREEPLTSEQKQVMDELRKSTISSLAKLEGLLKHFYDIFPEIKS